jgi:hypothetical protein
VHGPHAPRLRQLVGHGARHRDRAGIEDGVAKRGFPTGVGDDDRIPASEALEVSVEGEHGRVIGAEEGAQGGLPLDACRAETESRRQQRYDSEGGHGVSEREPGQNLGEVHESSRSSE